MRRTPAARSGRDRHDQVGQRERVAERDQVARPLAAHDAGQLGHAQDVALRPAAVDDEAHRLGRDRDQRPRRPPAGRSIGLSETSTIRGRPLRSTWVSRRRSVAVGVARRSLVHRSSAHRVGRVVAPHGRSSHHSATSAPAGSARHGLGMTARASAAASAEMTWLPCPAGPREADADATPLVADRRTVASRSATTRTNARRPWLLVTASPRTARSTGRRTSRRPASAGSRAGRTARRSRRTRPGCRAGRTSRTGASAAGPRRGPERERLAGLDGDPPEVDAADGLDRGLDDVVRPDRDAARDDERVRAVGEAATQAGQDVVEVVGRDARGR